VHVPYKGSGPSITDLIGGQVQYTFDTPPAVLEHVRSGRLRAIAVASAQRLPSAPNVPTFGEAGLAGFTGGTWFGLFLPAKTPKAVADRVHAEALAVLQSPELVQAFNERNILPSPQSAEAFAVFVQNEVAKWKALAADEMADPALAGDLGFILLTMLAPPFEELHSEHVKVGAALADAVK
jgi:tripartite-type tricarboxylate transporter receptor subunit TctC